ncbi:hypothetical protein RhiJN_05463 [Ceratobasidium sp. AG-Ba]|nr:hypothetical protein RhiJN_05463 [Ceratobasidium sp. AG-Ba]QRW06397.1 hypothetical protein RhiLY_05396 [Ceratobasidium sp. AG-Ba]
MTSVHRGNTANTPRATARPRSPSARSSLSVSVLVRNPSLFQQWTDAVHLIQDIQTIDRNDILLKPLCDILESAKLIPRWLVRAESSQLASSQQFRSEIELLCADIEEDATLPLERRDFQPHDQNDTELQSAINPILSACRITKRLLENLNPRPNEADLRTPVDALMQFLHNIEETNIHHSHECLLKVPEVPPPVRIASVKPDAADMILFPTLRGYDSVTGPQLSCHYLSSQPLTLLVVHCVTEYKSLDAKGDCQALVAIVSAMYQRLALGFDKHLIFGIIHSYGVDYRVVAAVWRDDKINIYHLGSFHLQVPPSALRFYLLMREIRKLGNEYREEIMQAGRRSPFSTITIESIPKAWAPFNPKSTGRNPGPLENIGEAAEHDGAYEEDQLDEAEFNQEIAAWCSDVASHVTGSEVVDSTDLDSNFEQPCVLDEASPKPEQGCGTLEQSESSSSQSSEFSTPDNSPPLGTGGWEDHDNRNKLPSSEPSEVPSVSIATHSGL